MTDITNNSSVTVAGSGYVNKLTGEDGVINEWSVETSVNDIEESIIDREWNNMFANTVDVSVSVPTIYKGAKTTSLRDHQLDSENYVFLRLNTQGNWIGGKTVYPSFGSNQSSNSLLMHNTTFMQANEVWVNGENYKDLALSSSGRSTDVGSPASTDKAFLDVLEKSTGSVDVTFTRGSDNVVIPVTGVGVHTVDLSTLTGNGAVTCSVTGSDSITAEFYSGQDCEVEI